MEVLNGGASSPKAFCVVLVLGAYDFLKSRSVHDCFGCFLFRFASMVFIFVFILVGGCVGGREEGTWCLCTLVGQAPCFSSGSILTKWEVHCCCFEAQHQTRGVTSHGHPSPLKWSWGSSAGVSKPAHQWDWTQNLYWSQGVPKWTIPMSHHP